jgi:S-DNA-T family DNA segregation ATPase FtsK/SpoIIIE
MNSAQRAVVAAAKKDGLSPMEVAAELMNHDITEVVLGLMRKREVAFNKLGEKEQDAVIAEIGAELKKITATAARVINSQGVECVQAKMKSLKIDGKLTATMVIEGDEPNRHVLTDKTHDKSDILIVLYSNNYNEGMSAHVGEKDQKPLDLEGDGKPAGKKSAPKAKAGTEKKIELTPKLIADGRDFVTIQQNASIKGLQNILHIGYDKAEALLKLYEGEGLVKFVGTDQNGQYEIVRAGKPLTDAPDALVNSQLYGELTYSEVQQTVVLHATNFELAWLVSRFKIDEERASHLCLQLLDDGVIEALASTDLDAEPQYEVIAKLEDLTI